jgi:hypothetical protein
MLDTGYSMVTDEKPDFELFHNFFEIYLAKIINR